MLVPTGTVVVTIQASDQNSPNTPFGQIRYRFAGGAGDNFVVDPVSGAVTVAPGAQLVGTYNITVRRNLRVMHLFVYLFGFSVLFAFLYMLSLADAITWR